MNQRVSAEGKDELAQLGKTFNHMAESLQRAEDSRKAMTADIAHELRTPLAVQRATVEAMLDGVYPLDEDSLQPVLEQNLLLARLVDDLRTLALADAGELRLDKVETDIARVAASVMNRFQSQAGKTGIMLDFRQNDEEHCQCARSNSIGTNLNQSDGECHPIYAIRRYHPNGSYKPGKPGRNHSQRFGYRNSGRTPSHIYLIVSIG